MAILSRKLMSGTIAIEKLSDCKKYKIWWKVMNWTLNRERPLGKKMDKLAILNHTHTLTARNINNLHMEQTHWACLGSYDRSSKIWQRRHFSSDERNDIVFLKPGLYGEAITNQSSREYDYSITS